MSATCRAVVFAGDGTWELRDDFSVPEPPAGGAVLAVEAVGLCHSDVAQLAGHHHVPGEVNPVVPGHEIVGRVHALADDADLGACTPLGPAGTLDFTTEVTNLSPDAVQLDDRALHDRVAAAQVLGRRPHWDVCVLTFFSGRFWCLGPLGAASALKIAARACSEPPGCSKVPLGPAQEPPGRSKMPLGRCLGATERSKVAFWHCSGAPVGSKVAFEQCLGTTRRSKVAFGLRL